MTFKIVRGIPPVDGIRMFPRRTPRSIAVLIALGIFIIPAAAEARTHRFAPSHEVTVTLELRKPTATGSLVRFARNRLTLTRRRSGVLELRSPGSRAHRLATRGRRSLRVRVVLSAGRGTAKLVVGKGTASVAGPFVAEDAVVVRSGRAVTALRIRSGKLPAAADGRPGTGGAPNAAAGPTQGPSPTAMPSPTPTPTAVPTPVAGQLFAPDSVWNAPLPSDAPLDPASAELAKKLSDTVWDGFAAGRSSWIQESDTSTPLYVVPAHQPTVRVTLDAGAWATSLQQAFEQVPIPPNAQPAAGSDAHMTIWQPSTDHLWEFFDAELRSDGWHASFGGAMSSASSSPGYYDDSAWPTLSHSYWGATATSLPVIAGTMRISELKAGVIPHALALNIPWARPNVYSWPAQRTDGRSTDPTAIPEGAHFRLDPTLDLSTLNLPPMTRMMAEAAQRYGMIVRDQTGWAVAVFAEDPTPTGTNPYAGANGFYGGQWPSDLMKAFPWDHLQLLRMDLHGG